jgi:hypothetical protein
MTIQPEEAVRAMIVAGTPGVTIGQRCYPIKAPQGAVRPYITFRRISGAPERHMGGPVPLAPARIQVECYAATYGAAKALADAVRLTLDGFRGEVAVGTATFYARSIALMNDLDDFVEPQAGTDDGVYVVAADWRVIYVLPTPP